MSVNNDIIKYKNKTILSNGNVFINNVEYYRYGTLIYRFRKYGAFYIMYSGFIQRGYSVITPRVINNECLFYVDRKINLNPPFIHYIKK